MYVLCVLIYINENSSFRYSHVLHCRYREFFDKNVSSYSKLIFKVDKICNFLYFHVHSEHYFSK